MAKIGIQNGAAVSLQRLDSSVMEYEIDFLEVGIVGLDGWGVGWVSFLTSRASS